MKILKNNMLSAERKYTNCGCCDLFHMLILILDGLWASFSNLMTTAVFFKNCTNQVL